MKKCKNICKLNEDCECYKDGLKEGRAEMKQEILKIIEEINWDMTILINELKDDLKLDATGEEGYRSIHKSWHSIKRNTLKNLYQFVDKWQNTRKKIKLQSAETSGTDHKPLSGRGGVSGIPSEGDLSVAVQFGSSVVSGSADTHNKQKIKGELIFGQGIKSLPDKFKVKEQKIKLQSADKPINPDRKGENISDKVICSGSKSEVKTADISLCSNCYCMTKTINGRCGKCKKIKGEK